MVVTGFDGKEYEVEPNANLSGTDLAVEGSSLELARLERSRLQSPGSEGGLLGGV